MGGAPWVCAAAEPCVWNETKEGVPLAGSQVVVMGVASSQVGGGAWLGLPGLSVEGIRAYGLQSPWHVWCGHLTSYSWAGCWDCFSFHCVM